MLALIFSRSKIEASEIFGIEGRSSNSVRINLGKAKSIADRKEFNSISIISSSGLLLAKQEKVVKKCIAANEYCPEECFYIGTYKLLKSNITIDDRSFAVSGTLRAKDFKPLAKIEVSQNQNLSWISEKPMKAKIDYFHKRGGNYAPVYKFLQGNEGTDLQLTKIISPGSDPFTSKLHYDGMKVISFGPLKVLSGSTDYEHNLE